MCLGIPGQIIAKQGEGFGLSMGTISFGGVTKEVSLAFVPEAEVGDYVIIHAGFAISKIDEQEAQETLALLQQLADLSGIPAVEAPGQPQSDDVAARR